MLRYAVVFLVVALIAGVLGFGGIASGAVDIARILFRRLYCSFRYYRCRQCAAR
jgi:uncharacterized membrane protein YtjA (UPF0391 family)